MKIRRGLRLLAAGALFAGVVMVPAPAGSQVSQTAVEFVFSGVAQVRAGGDPAVDGIFIPGLDSSSNTKWEWNFQSTLTCQGTGVSAGAPASGACALSGQGPLLGDLTNPGQPLHGQMKNAPYCGNSRGVTGNTTMVQEFDPNGKASFQDPSNRIWRGEVHWDGVLRGDPSYSLGSQLLLFGEMSSTGAGKVEVILFLNASGGSNCFPQISKSGATSFTVNGEGTIRTKL